MVWSFGDRRSPLDSRAEINAKDEWGATARDQARESLDRDDHPRGSEADL
jgi:hypothetical protein